MADGGLTQEEIDALLAGTGLDDIDDDDENKDSSPQEKVKEEKKIISQPPRAAIKTASFPKTDDIKLGSALDHYENQNLALLLDVKVTLTVELGRSKLTIKDILSLTDGSVIELQKFAGEAVDIMVNNVLIARGNVIIIDENYGVQITDIIDPIERFKSLL